MHISKIINQICICFILLASLLTFLNVEVYGTSGEEIWVDDDFIYCDEADGSLSKPFCTIQAAIEAAKSGLNALIVCVENETSDLIARLETEGISYELNDAEIS